MHGFNTAITNMHLLDSAVREVDKVGPRGNEPVPLLGGAKVGSRVVVGDGVGVRVEGGLVGVGDGLLLRPGEAGAGQGGDDEQGGLQQKIN